MEDRLIAIELALENEIRERDFYLYHAGRTKNALGKKMFQCIADDENSHYERFKKLHQQLSAKGQWPETVSGAVKETNIKDVLRTIEAASSNANADNDDCQALKTAIEFEEKGYSFYTKLSADASASDEKIFFSRLASVEKEHLLSLKETLLYFEDPAAWLAQREKPGLEG